MADLLNISKESVPEKQENVEISKQPVTEKISQFPEEKIKKPFPVIEKIKEIIPHKKTVGTDVSQIKEEERKKEEKPPFTKEAVQKLTQNEIEKELQEFNQKESIRGVEGIEEIMGENQDKFYFQKQKQISTKRVRK